MSRLAGELAVLTGASGAIGRVMATQLAAEGAGVVLADLDSDTGEAVAAEIRSSGGAAWYYKYDVSNIEDRHHFVDSVSTECGDITILINNAVSRAYSTIFELSAEDWDRSYSVNVRGAFFLLQAVAQKMQHLGRGSIINISSIAGKGHATKSVAYGSSKAAIIGMTRTAALELAPLGIRVNAVCPGSTRSTRTNSDAKRTGAGLPLEEVWKRRAESIPIRRWNDPQDVANLVCFLASNDARNVVGQSWNVDGGLVFD